ncbi:SMI1/KNR4 family protein [Streptomyces tsukubensis]|uniref:SMI1/KNR4 family protein n=1 Tax=Streptomyces tsukubensis TaxID=83656 RepID=A0A1V4A5B9_9ACTN|nr:SMI1/KNR4 family protein [Streptomyces tsukubensis]OON75931.1 SMI1/KNR4 family protein [Streptomyces tsukubensis]QFR94024.1 SMI1/KNR4 family protein [Streptomyces tsukubensis]
MAPSPLTVPEWRQFLSDYSAKFLASDLFREADAEGRSFLSEAQREARWLGYEPAAEAAVLAAEERFGVRLPPTYRNFLLASNGCKDVGLIDLLGIEKIGWFSDMTDLLDYWLSPGDGYLAEDLDKFERSLLISIDDGGSGGYWVLHADSAREDGEWTAYEWWPGEGGDPERYENFATLVTSAADYVLS